MTGYVQPFIIDISDIYTDDRMFELTEYVLTDEVDCGSLEYTVAITSYLDPVSTVLDPTMI